MQIPTPLVLRVLKIILASTSGTAAIMSAPSSTGIKNNTRATVQPSHHVLPTMYTGIKNNTRAL